MPGYVNRNINGTPQQERRVLSREKDHNSAKGSWTTGSSLTFAEERLRQCDRTMNVAGIDGKRVTVSTGVRGVDEHKKKDVSTLSLVKGRLFV